MPKQYFAFKKENIGGYLKFGFQHKIKHFALDYYIGLGNKFIFENINRTDKFEYQIIERPKYCDAHMYFPDYIFSFFETGISIGFN